MIRFLAPFLLLAALHGSVTLDEINIRPPGLAKNFLIWQYLQQDITPHEADEAFYQIRHVNKRLFMAYAKKSSDESVKYTAECWKQTAQQMYDNDKDDCTKTALSPYAAIQLDADERQQLFRRFSDTPDAKWLAMVSDANMSQHLESFDPKTFLKVANGTGSAFRRKHFNQRLSAEYVAKLERTPGFSTFVRLVVTGDEKEQLQRALLDAPGMKVNAQTAFFLAMNQLRYHQKHEALLLFDKVYETSYFRMDKDKALFWKYQISDDDKVLKMLSESFDLNIYSIYAKELLETPIDNYFTMIKTSSEKARQDITDPFVWNSILGEIKSTPKEDLFSLAVKYQNRSLVGVQAFILERASGYKMHNFIMPYATMMSGLSNSDKAMMLALMRQESHFIPSALSRSYALGLMQIMPFLVKALDKEFTHKRTSLYEMFMPQTNITYAIKHLQWLQDRLYHPLFIAYAYNGGIGFTKRHLLKGTFREGRYEPFLSMELMGNSESREYGKKVLANYVIYKKILGERVSIAHLFDTLTQPSHTDRFRK